MKKHNYRPIEEYNPEAVKTCYESFLSKEIEIVRPKVVFCFGTRVENCLWNLYPGDYPFKIVTLPHPASARRGFKDEFFRHLYFSMILDGLYQVGIIALNEAQVRYAEFLSPPNGHKG